MPHVCETDSPRNGRKTTMAYRLRLHRRPMEQTIYRDVPARLRGRQALSRSGDLRHALTLVAATWHAAEGASTSSRGRCSPALGLGTFLSNPLFGYDERLEIRERHTLHFGSGCYRLAGVSLRVARFPNPSAAAQAADPPPAARCLPAPKTSRSACSQSSSDVSLSCSSSCASQIS